MTTDTIDSPHSGLHSIHDYYRKESKVALDFGGLSHVKIGLTALCGICSERVTHRKFSPLCIKDGQFLPKARLSMNFSTLKNKEEEVVAMLWWCLWKRCLHRNSSMFYDFPLTHILTMETLDVGLV